MKNSTSTQDWFAQDLSDEAAFAIHRFLEQFTYNFEGAYYSQICRYLEENSPQRSLPEKTSAHSSDSKIDKKQQKEQPF